MLAFSIDYYGMIFRATQSVELFCAYETMEVDWVGDTLKVYDAASCYDIPAYIFVAVLPCSLYGYAEAFPDMKSNHWIEAHIISTSTAVRSSWITSSCCLIIASASTTVSSSPATMPITTC